MTNKKKQLQRFQHSLFQTIKYVLLREKYKQRIKLQWIPKKNTLYKIKILGTHYRTHVNYSEKLLEMNFKKKNYD